MNPQHYENLSNLVGAVHAKAIRDSQPIHPMETVPPPMTTPTQPPAAGQAAHTPQDSVCDAESFCGMIERLHFGRFGKSLSLEISPGTNEFGETETQTILRNIQRACNSHDALVAALEEVTLAASALFGEFSDFPRRLHSALNFARTKDGRTVAPSFLDRARAALAAAKEVQP